MEIFKTADMETYNKVYINASALFLIIMDHSADQATINMYMSIYRSRIHASLSVLTTSPIFQERRICVRKNLDICNLSGQLGINPKRLNEWLLQSGISMAANEAEPGERSDRSTPPYRLAAPSSLSLAPSSGQTKLYRGRRSTPTLQHLPASLQRTRRISKNC
jgi:hypothetical protein